MLILCLFMSKSYLRTDGRTTQNYSLEPHKNQMKNKIDTQSHTQKLKIFFWYFEMEINFLITGS